MTAESFLFYMAQFIDGFNLLEVGKLSQDEHRSCRPENVWNEQTSFCKNKVIEENPNISKLKKIVQGLIYSGVRWKESYMINFTCK